MKAFKTFHTALKHANGGPVLRVGDLYLAEPVTDLICFGLLSIDLIGPKGHVTATITTRSLERLGNGNYAEPKRACGGPAKVFTAEINK
jgi:hypothetical protein